MNKHIENDDFWPSISDLMSGLMIIFMFIAISFMSQISREKEEYKDQKIEIEKLAEEYKQQKQYISELAEEYKKVKVNIYNDLFKEFKQNLFYWNAYIDKETLSVKFREPDIFFMPGSTELNSKFQEILDDFFPRYIAILNSEKYRNEIEEVRIEGHTSTEWTKNSTPMESYFKNMELSQGRTRSTLQYVMNLNSMSKHEKFMIEKITANGLSYSKKILVAGIEDKKMSRRVEFRIRTKAEQKIDQILERANEINKF
jgi:outer membrane protein OmpA-like peptidoglycan-associated protein